MWPKIGSQVESSKWPAVNGRRRDWYIFVMFVSAFQTYGRTVIEKLSVLLRSSPQTKMQAKMPMGGGSNKAADHSALRPEGSSGLASFGNEIPQFGSSFFGRRASVARDSHQPLLCCPFMT